MTINAGTMLRFINYDTAPHRVHSDGGAGFPHQDFDMGPGQEYDVTPTGTSTTYRFYCHSHGESTGETNLTVQ